MTKPARSNQKKSNPERSNRGGNNQVRKSKSIPLEAAERDQDLRLHTRKASPRLKSGIRYWRSDFSRQLYIGSRFSNFLLPDRIGSMEIESALSALNKGERFESPELQILLSVLESLSLLDYEKTEIDYRYRNDESRDIATSLKRSVAQESFLARIKIESDGITRIGNVRDGGTRKILERREFAIQIRGSGRIAYSLLGTLIASGFDLCKISNNREISSRDLIGGCVSKRDIGMAAEIKADELLHEASLYPEPLEIPKEVDLIVSIGPPLPELLQEWNREQIPQLFIDFDNPGEIRIGPYVTPGIGACYNCLNIGEIERGQPVLNALKNSLEKSIHGSQELDVTAALASFTAGIVALTIAEIADTGRSALHEKSALFSMLDFLEPQITSWERSPRCGCNWI